MVKKILHVFSTKQKFHLFVLYCITFIGALFEMLGLAGILSFINALTAPHEFIQNQYVQIVYTMLGFSRENDFVIFISVLLMIVYALKNAFMLLMSELQYRFVFKNQHRLSVRMLKAYIHEPYLFHASRNSVELRNNIANDVDTFFVVVLNCIQMLSEATICIMLLLVMLVADKTITIGVALFMGVILLVYTKVYRQRVDFYGNNRRNYAIRMNKWLEQALEGIKEIKILNGEKYFLSQYQSANYIYAESRRKHAFFSATPKPVMEASCIIAVLLVVTLKLARGVDPKYFVNTLYIFALAAYRILPSASKVATNMSTIMFNRASVDALYDDLVEIETRQLEEEKDCKHIQSENSIQLNFDDQIEIRNLCFRYPSSKDDILSNANLLIKKNKSTAFIGPSGAGKTTLADIVLGVLVPQKGSVYVHDVNVFNCLDEWHNKLSYIPQNIYLMDDTIRNNVAFGINEEKIEDEKIWKALKDAQLEDFVLQLDKGLDTVIGERGIRFSGGQRQRLGIARALYRDAEILVLDEATSALDNETEKSVMEAIDGLAGKKTLIIIAHRLSTIQNCDEIYEIVDKKVHKKEKRAEE